MNPTFNTIDVIVSDMDKALEFYNHLGLKFEVSAYMPGHADCALPNGMSLMLDTQEGRAPTLANWGTPTEHPRTFLAFEFTAPADVDAKHAELTAAGYTSMQPPWDAPWGMRYATVSDPSGNGVDLYSRLPQS